MRRRIHVHSKCAFKGLLKHLESVSASEEACQGFSVGESLEGRRES